VLRAKFFAAHLAALDRGSPPGKITQTNR